MLVLIISALACACSIVVFIAPNVVALGGISAIAFVAITALSMIGSHSAIEALGSAALFVGVFQTAFFLSCFGVISAGRAPSKKLGNSPYA